MNLTNTIYSALILLSLNVLAQAKIKEDNSKQIPLTVENLEFQPG
jgi:hypothetical protein